jgi:hypothetical protein
MSMSQGERIRRIEEEAKVYISRTKVRDASELTNIRQAQASKTQTPQTITDTRFIGDSIDSIGNNVQRVTIKGKGTHMEYTNVLQNAEHNAICGDSQVQNNPYLALGTYVPAPCYDRNKPPFAQQDLTIPDHVYVPQCVPGTNTYFPRINDSTCVYDRVITPSG